MTQKSLINICLGGFGLIILAASLLSFYRLDLIPYGFHVDELSSSVDIKCMNTEGTDAHHVRYPLFANLYYGNPKPPTYIYPGMIWCRLLGYSVASLRAFCVSVHLFGILGLFLLARSFFGWRCAVLTTAAAILSPWTWNLSRVAFESLFAITFLSWGLYFFFKQPKTRNLILSGVCFAAAMYAYPPFRLQTPLMILTLFIFTFRKNPWPLKSWIFFILTISGVCIPLIVKTMNGELQNRFEAISINSKAYLTSIHSSGQITEIIRIFLNNFFVHLSPDFLIFKGDPSYVHSTGHFGILSWLDMAALGLVLIWIFRLIFRLSSGNNPLIKQKGFLIFCLINILIGILPAALTNSELPNSLRITGSWNFMCLMTGYILWQVCELFWGLWLGSLILSAAFAACFLNVYFKTFPEEGKGMFSYWALDNANQAKTDQDWIKFLVTYRYQDYTARYFLMEYKSLSCTESDNAWNRVGKLLKEQGL